MMKKQQDIPRKDSAFAEGLGFYKLFWVFLVGCVMGVVIEVIWCLVTRLRLESRTALIYGSFNPVYGFGAVVITLGLYWLAKKNGWWVFVGSVFLGAAFEYLCSVVQEFMFGTVSWEYSEMPLNLEGRINFLYSLFWGFLGLWWMKWCYPRLSSLIERIPKRVGVPLTWVLVVFMVLNMAVSSLAVARYTQRHEGVPAENAVSVFLDAMYPDDLMRVIYPNMIFADEAKK